MLRSIAGLLEQELAELDLGMVTFTEVELSRDLRHARVYYSFFGDVSGREQIAEYLQRHAPRIRREMGRHLHVRHLPELTFKFDPSIERGIRIEQLLKELRPPDHE